MSGPSPSDLAVAFRSFGRRLGEALGPADEQPERAASAFALVERLRDVIEQAASDLGVPVRPGADISATSLAVADRIEHTHADEWRPGMLERLSDQAITAGGLVRDISRVFG